MIKPIKAILQQNLSRLGYSVQVTCSSSYDKSDCSINQCNLETCRNSLEWMSNSPYNSFIYSFIYKYLLHTYMPSTILGSVVNIVISTESLCLHGAYILEGGDKQ